MGENRHLDLFKNHILSDKQKDMAPEDSKYSLSLVYCIVYCIKME